jgi:hypothetical protein
MDDFYVVRLVNDFDLIVNMGKGQVEVDEILEVLDPRTQDVRDPKTGETLGSLDLPKCQVYVKHVADHMALCSVFGRSTGLSAVSAVMSGSPRISVAGAGPKWPEGVEPQDPIRRIGRRRRAP